MTQSVAVRRRLEQELDDVDWAVNAKLEDEYGDSVIVVSRDDRLGIFRRVTDEMFEYVDWGGNLSGASLTKRWRLVSDGLLDVGWKLEHDGMPRRIYFDQLVVTVDDIERVRKFVT